MQNGVDQDFTLIAILFEKNVKHRGTPLYLEHSGAHRIFNKYASLTTDSLLGKHAFSKTYQ